jgi:hypothetical protein
VLGQHTLKPKESTTISTIYRTANLPGPFKKIVSISTDIPGQDDIEITLEGQVKEAPCAKIQVTPRRLDLGTVKLNSEKKQTITITNPGTLPLQIGRITGKESNTIYFDGTLIVAPGESVVREISIRANKNGPLTETIVIQSNARNATKAGFIIMAKGSVQE